MFIRRSHCRWLVLILGLLLFVTPVHIRAHDEDDEPIAHVLSKGFSVDEYNADFDLRSAAPPVINFSMGYGATEIFKRTIPLLLFLLLPAVWTMFSARRFAKHREELWGRHLLFLHRLMTALWLIWLPVYALSGIGELVFFLLGPGHTNAAHGVNIAFYFVPPMLAMVLCDLASREVYRLVPEVNWSRRDFIRHAISTTSFSMMPLFLTVLAVNTISREPFQAAGYATVSYVAWLVVKQAAGRVWTPSLFELPAGELRTQIYDLGQKAGVVLQHIYVLPDARPQLATAAARKDGSVMLSSSVINNLSRREVDAIMAHEIGHVQARHAQRIGTIAWGIAIVANLIGSLLAAKLHLAHSTEIVFSAALTLSTLTVAFIQRRDERQADEFGVNLTGDSEAFISGLARLSRMSLQPLQFEGWGALLDSHPGTMSRFESIARAHGISEERLKELLVDSDNSADRYPPFEQEETATIQSFIFKHKYRVRVALALFGVLIFAPLPFALLLVRSDLSAVMICSIAVAGFVFSFGLYQVVRNRISFWGHGPLSRELKAKLEKRGFDELARAGTLVGLAPAATTRKYYGYSFWDAGVLWLTADKLYYIGEQTEFALQRDQVTGVYSRNTNAEWFSEKSLFLQWQNDSEANTQTLHFVALGEKSVRKARRAIASLQKRVEAWMQGSENFPAASPEFESIAGPAFPRIGSRPAITSFRFAPIIAAGIHLSIYAAAAGFLLGLTLIGTCYAIGVIFLCAVLDELPKTFMPVYEVASEPPPPIRTDERPTYQPGSWIGDEVT